MSKHYYPRKQQRMFRTLNKDNTDNEIVVQGARSRSSNQDIASIVFNNYDNDTSNVYRMAEIAVKDSFGNADSNGFGNLVFRTNGLGTTSTDISERMIIDYRGFIGIGTRPLSMLHVAGDVLVGGSIISDGSNNLSSVINATFWASNNVGMMSANADTSVAIFASNTTVSTSNDIYPKIEWTCNFAESMSNNLYKNVFSDVSASNLAYASNTANFASNLVVYNSNNSFPQSTFASNTAVFASNLAITNSNLLFPQAAFGSNLGITSSNLLFPQAAFGSNLGITNSNLLFPKTTFGSNLGITNSNTLFPQTAFGSNLGISNSNLLFPKATYGSNIGVTISNQLYPQTAFASNIGITNSNLLFPKATFGSNLGITISNLLFPQSIFASNMVVNNSNLLFPQVTFASNLSISNSNILFPQATFASNLSISNSNILSPQVAFASNLSISNSNVLFPQALFTSNLTVSNSNMLFPQAIFASNLGVTNSNLGISMSNILFIQASYASNTSIYASNSIISNSNDIYPSILYASNTASYASNLDRPWVSSGSSIYILSSNVGIDLTDPAESLSIMRNMSLSNYGKVVFTTSNNNLGIGVSIPTYLLDVGGDLNVDSNLYVRGVNYNFGREFFYSSNFSAATGTTGTTYINRYSMSTVLEGGYYLFTVMYGMQAANTNRVGMGRVQLSNIQSPSNYVHISSNNTSTNGYNYVSDMTYLQLPTGSNIFTLQYCVSTGGGNTTITVKDSKMSLFRVQ